MTTKTKVEMSPGGIGFVYVTDPEIANGIPQGTRFRSWAEKPAPKTAEPIEIKPSAAGQYHPGSMFKVTRNGKVITAKKAESIRKKRAKLKSRFKRRNAE